MADEEWVPIEDRPRALGPDSINDVTVTAADVKPLIEKDIDD